MAGPQKKRALQKKSENGDETDNYTRQEVIQADFEGRNPEGVDFNGIKQLLQQLFLKAHIDVSQLSDMLISQAGIGSVLKQSSDDDEDDEDDDETTDPSHVFGITSVLNLSSCKETPCVQQLFSLLVELASEHADKSVETEIRSILKSSKKLGLLINERIINIPAKIADPLFSSLQGELERSVKRDPSYNFDFYIMICKGYKSKENGDSELMFANAEEEVFSKEAKITFEFNVSKESDTAISGSWSEEDKEMIPFRKILFINGKKFSGIVQQVKQFVA